MTIKPIGRTRMFHEVPDLRPATCRRAGCEQLAVATRYEPADHAWNAFCNVHADEVEATMAKRGTRAHGVETYKY